jgi:hypothetical protein
MIYAVNNVEFGASFRFLDISIGATANFFDIIRMSDTLRTIRNRPMSTVMNASTTSYPSSYWRWSYIDLTYANGFAPNFSYQLIIHDTDDTVEPELSAGAIQVHPFHVVPALGAKIDLANSRLTYLRNVEENVLLPRTKRLLALEGENMVMDDVVVDAAGNMTSYRIRLFSTKDDADYATPDILDSVLPEPGEIYAYRVTQTWDARGTRVSHTSSPISGFEPVDGTATDNQTPPQGYAAGNTGWPV